MYHSFIVGEKVYLRGIERKDLEGPYFQWANDPKVTEYMFMGLKPNSLVALEEEYNTLMKSSNDVAFLVIDKQTDKPIGSAGIYAISWVARTAEYRVMIGEKDFWDKGYGTEIAHLLMEYAFGKLNLNNLWLGVNADNPRAVKSYENAGFVTEGRLRALIYRNGKYYDVIKMNILRDEYYSKIKKA